MLTLEKLNALRGISSGAAKSDETKTKISSQANQNVAPNTEPATAMITPTQAQQAPQNSQTGYPEPIEIPCKNYADEQGHFAYIDANTGQISHVNLENGNVYKLDDIYRLSLQHSVAALSEEYHKLVWQQVLNDETVYDRFGCPIFTFEEIQTAYDKYIKPTISSGTENVNNPLKTDPFGFPL